MTDHKEDLQQFCKDVGLDHTKVTNMGVKTVSELGDVVSVLEYDLTKVENKFNVNTMVATKLIKRFKPTGNSTGRKRGQKRKRKRSPKAPSSENNTPEQDKKQEDREKEEEVSWFGGVLNLFSRSDVITKKNLAEDFCKEQSTAITNNPISAVVSPRGRGDQELRCRKGYSLDES